MRRSLLFFISFCVLVSGCSRVERDTLTQTVIFNLGGIERGDMTRATVPEFLGSLKNVSYPTLTVESVSDPTFYTYAEVGEAITLPIGQYQVTASYEISNIGVVGGHTVVERPIYKIDETVSVVAGQSTISLTGIYQCWALVINYNTTSQYRTDGKLFNFVKSSDNEWGVLFISTTAKGNPWTLIAYPQDDVAYEEATYSISDNLAGYWYIYNPTEKTEETGAFSITLPEWIEAQ